MRQASEGFLIVYAITSRSSYDELSTLRDQVEFFLNSLIVKILRVKDVDFVPMVVVGNKADLLHERQVVVIVIKWFN